MKTEFVNEEGKRWDYEGEFPTPPLKIQIYGPWGNRRVVDVVININSPEPKQTIYMGLINIHG